MRQSNKQNRSETNVNQNKSKISNRAQFYVINDILNMKLFLFCHVNSDKQVSKTTARGPVSDGLCSHLIKLGFDTHVSRLSDDGPVISIINLFLFLI